MGFSRQENWSGLPFPSPGDLPKPCVWTRVSCIAGGVFTIWAPSLFLVGWAGSSCCGAFLHLQWWGGCSLGTVLRLLLLGSSDPRVTAFSCGTGALEHRLSSQEDYFKRRPWRCKGGRKKPSRSLPHQTQSRKFQYVWLPESPSLRRGCAQRLPRAQWWVKLGQ